MECPRCGVEVEEPIKKWTWKKTIVMGFFKCPKCGNRFKSAVKSTLQYREFIEVHPTVLEWLDNRPKNTQRSYGMALQKFCEFSNIKPKEFQDMDRKEARKIAWNYIKALKNESPSLATITMATLKSYYRYKDGEILSFDARRGGKHYINNHRRQRVKYEHVPNNQEVYQIADMALSLRDRSMFLTLFQSGIRANALCNLTYGMVRDQLKQGKVPLLLRITDDIDTKLQGYSISYYKTFIDKEAIEALRKYCEIAHNNSQEDEPLFKTRHNTSVNPTLLWTVFKKAVVRAGFERRSMTVHTLRKAFRKVTRRARIDDDFKEAIMGHRIPGSRENYFSRKDHDELEKMYKEFDFSREGKVEYEDLSNKIEVLKQERSVLNNVIVKQSAEMSKLKEQVELTQGVGAYIDTLYKQMEAMQKQLNELTGKKRKLEVPVFTQPEQ